MEAIHIFPKLPDPKKWLIAPSLHTDPFMKWDVMVVCLVVLLIAMELDEASAV